MIKKSIKVINYISVGINKSDDYFYHTKLRLGTGIKNNTSLLNQYIFFASAKA